MDVLQPSVAAGWGVGLGVGVVVLVVVVVVKNTSTARPRTNERNITTEFSETAMATDTSLAVPRRENCRARVDLVFGLYFDVRRSGGR